MVFESLLNVKLAERTPWLTFFFGVIYSSVSILLAQYVMPEQGSIVMVFFVTLLFLPLFYNSFIREEEADLKDGATETSLLKSHSKPIIFFTFLFLGLTISFSIWYVLLASIGSYHMPVDKVFSSQLTTINQLNGKAIDGSGFQYLSYFPSILSNNMKVLLFCIIFSFVFGAGAIFILSWNSSVIGAALGKQMTLVIGATTGNIAGVYFLAGSCGILRYMIHGIPEIVSYFIAGLAGGIISVALARHDFGTPKFEKIFIDCSYLFLISIGLLILAAILEVTVTPAIMCRFT
jgi:uncharacterized membrane protein SpoIIM required for sporulation